MVLFSNSGRIIGNRGIPSSKGKKGKWEKNTFPSDGHRLNEGPWGYFQGSDRAEWVSFFQGHPTNENFMLMGTDLSRLTYTNTRLNGSEFIPANIPLSYTCTCSFDPHQPNRAFVLMGSQELSGASGWWETIDEGETWNLMYPIETVNPRLTSPTPDEYSRGLKQLLIVSPTPSLSGDMYIGTHNNGILKSVDGGNSFTPYAMSGDSINCMSITNDGNYMYVIKGSQLYHNNGGSDWGPVWLLDLSQPPGQFGTITSSMSGDIIWVEPHKDPSKPDEGFYVDYTNKNFKRFSNYGSTDGDVILNTANSPTSIHQNPNNYNHALLYISNTVRTLRFSTNINDPTPTFISLQNNMVNISGNEYVNMIDYGPINFRDNSIDNNWLYPSGSPQYLQERHLLTSFVPNMSSSVRYWGTNFMKSPLQSDDFGETWYPFAHGGTFKRSLQQDFGANDGIVGTSVTEYGIRITENGGKSWRGHSQYNTMTLEVTASTQTGFLERSSWGFAFHPTDPKICICTHSDDPCVIKRTTDMGYNWIDIEQFNPNNPYGAEQLVFWSKINPDVVYVGDRRSTDAGLTFLPMTPAESSQTYISALSPHNENLILHKRSGSLIYVSTNGGNTWVKIPSPPTSPDGGNTTIINGTSNMCIIFDNDPTYSPYTNSTGEFRILVGGWNGMYSYIGTVNSPNSGSWNQHLINTTPDPYNDAHGYGIWFAHVFQDPRKGHTKTLYIFPGYTAAGRHRGDLFYRQGYVSYDGGTSWESIYDVDNILPDFLSVLCGGVNPHTGDLWIQDYTGCYILRQPNKVFDYNYSEALQKSLYFLECQMSGPLPPWHRVEWRGDSFLTAGSDVYISGGPSLINGVDATGMWFDAGDLWTTANTMGKGVTWLAKSVIDFPTSYTTTGQMEHVLNQLRHCGDVFSRLIIDLNPDIPDNFDYYNVIVDVGGHIQFDNGTRILDYLHVHSQGNSAEVENLIRRTTYRAMRDVSGNGHHPSRNDCCGKMCSSLSLISIALDKYGNSTDKTNAITYAKKARKLLKFVNDYRSDLGDAYKKSINSSYHDWTVNTTTNPISADVNFDTYVNVEYTDQLVDYFYGPALGYTSCHLMEKHFNTIGYSNEHIDNLRTYLNSLTTQQQDAFWTWWRCGQGTCMAHLMWLESGDYTSQEELDLLDVVEDYINRWVNPDTDPNTQFDARFNKTEYGLIQRVNAGGQFAYTHTAIVSMFITKYLHLYPNSQNRKKWLDFVFNQINYFLGNNKQGYSYLVGHGRKGYVSCCHHGNAFGPFNTHDHYRKYDDENNKSVGINDYYFYGNRHVLYGALIAPHGLNDNFYYLDATSAEVSGADAWAIRDSNDNFVGDGRLDGKDRWKFTEPVISSNPAVTYTFSALVEYYPIFQPPEPNFPKAEFRNLSLDSAKTGRQFFVQNNIKNTFTSTYINMDINLWNKSSYPPVEYDQMSYRYFFTATPNLSTGINTNIPRASNVSIGDFTVNLSFSDFPLNPIVPTIEIVEYISGNYYIDVKLADVKLSPTYSLSFGDNRQPFRRLYGNTLQITLNSGSWDVTTHHSYDVNNVNDVSKPINPKIPVYNNGIYLEGIEPT